MWGKNVATIYIRDSRYTKELIDASDTFSINFFEDDHMHSTLNYLGKVSGHNEDKIAGARLHINHMTGTPFLDEAKFVILCKKLSATRITADQFIDPTIADKWYADGDMHTMYIGEITDVFANICSYPKARMLFAPGLFMYYCSFEIVSCNFSTFPCNLPIVSEKS